MARSEEQWKDLKMKITVAVIVLVVGGAAYGIGPGLQKFVEHARAHKTEPWAPEWYYKLGRIYEATFREEEAAKIYQEFWSLYSGDERTLDFATVIERTKWEPPFLSMVPVYYGIQPDHEWVGGEGAKPHKLMADVLMRLSKAEEGRRNYQDARWYYMCVLVLFEPGTPAYVSAEAAAKRDATRSF